METRKPKYASLTEWATANPEAYSATIRQNLLPKICAMTLWNIEEAKFIKPFLQKQGNSLEEIKAKFSGVEQFYRDMDMSHYPNKTAIRRIAKQMGVKVEFSDTYREFGRQNHNTSFYTLQDDFIIMEEDQFETEEHLIGYINYITGKEK